MSEPSWLHLAILALIGLAAGVLNVLAGGGSLLTLPVLIFLGLPASTANGTNRIAILAQNLFAMAGFRRCRIFPRRLALLCAAPAMAGACLGAQLAVQVDDSLFRKILAVIMFGILGLTLWDPFKNRPHFPATLSVGRTLTLATSFFAIGVYGGFVQAGVGFLIIAGLMLHGLDLVQTNAVKVAVVFCFTLIALAVFIRHDQVHYGWGLALATGNAAGGWLGAHLAVKKGHAWIKRIVSLTIAAFALKLLLG